MYSILSHTVDESVPYNKLNKDEVIRNIQHSGLIGRGGAAFPVYKKWELFMSSASDEKYVIVNGHEGELGCAKDRYLMTHNLNIVLDGALITAYATGASKVILVIKQSDKDIVQNQIFNNDIELRIGSDQYIAGEESALISHIENGFAYPRKKPPFPVQSGLFGKPTLVHNVETMANISYIARNGLKDFCSLGTENNKGTKLFSISGDVNCPGVFEVPFGTSFRNILEDHADGVKGELFAILPGFSKVIYANDCKALNLDYDSFRSVNSYLGTGNIVVFNSKANLQAYIRAIVNFLSESSCKQCSTCRVMSKIAQLIVSNEKNYYAKEWEYISKNIVGLSRCSLMNSLVDMVNNYVALTI